MEYDKDLIKVRQTLIDDFPFYAKHCLAIRPKSGGVVPFELNYAQRHIHKLIEEQKARTGRVRAIILKRQRS